MHAGAHPTSLGMPGAGVWASFKKLALHLTRPVFVIRGPYADMAHVIAVADRKPMAVLTVSRQKYCVACHAAIPGYDDGCVL
jgi:hypothetical protein